MVAIDESREKAACGVSGLKVVSAALTYVPLICNKAKVVFVIGTSECTLPSPAATIEAPYQCIVPWSLAQVGDRAMVV